MTPLHTYLQELHTVRATGAGVKETSYYPAVSGLFNAVGKTLRPPVRCVLTLRNTGAGLPDGDFFTPDQYQKAAEEALLTGSGLPARGVLEVKGTGEDVRAVAASAQVEKYWAKYGQVLVTNLRDFALVGRDAGGRKAILETFSLAPTEADFWLLAANPNAAPEGLGERFAEYLKRVLLSRAPLAAPEDVAWFLASYARDARSRIEAADLPALASVRTALEQALGLKFTADRGEHFFRSTLVQTLFYGLFSAWVLWCKKQGGRPSPGSVGRPSPGSAGRPSPGSLRLATLSQRSGRGLSELGRGLSEAVASPGLADGDTDQTTASRPQEPSPNPLPDLWERVASLSEPGEGRPAEPGEGRPAEPGEGRPTEPGEGLAFDWRSAAWELHVPMIRALFEEVAKPSRLGPLGLVEVLDWTGQALNRVDRAAFFARFDQGQAAVQYFYEPFLQAFDPELRKDLGVWYTPPEIVRYMVARVDTALREELNIPDGLADPRVYVLDPCCGTGAYLVEVLRKIGETLDAQGGDALGGSDLKAAAMHRVFGFEILPAPFVVAHLQLGLLLQQAGVPLSDANSERASVYLTNALTGWEPPSEQAKAQLLQLALGFPDLKKEYDAAEEVKQGRKILVVLGNPPYNSFAGLAVSEERSLSEAYRTTQNAPKPQGQGLNDLYVRFFRMAERCITEQTGQGLVCFISNYSWLDGLSHTGMRERYLEAFDDIWIDSLNGDKYKTGKLTPEGLPDPSVFSTEFNREGIQVGTAIALMVRKQPHREAGVVRFKNWWGRAKRAELLDSAQPGLATVYQHLAPPPQLGLPFMPLQTGEDYHQWPLLPDLFPAFFPGVQTKRDEVVIDIDRNRLEARMRQYFDANLSNEAMRKICDRAMEDTAQYNAQETRAYLIKRGIRLEYLVRHCYRPFDLRWIYWEPETDLLNRRSPDYFPQVFEGNFWLISQQKPRREWSQPQFIRSLGCLDLMDRSASCFPLWLKPKPSEHLFSDNDPADGKPILNYSKIAKDYIQDLVLRSALGTPSVSPSEQGEGRKGQEGLPPSPVPPCPVPPLSEGEVRWGSSRHSEAPRNISQDINAASEDLFYHALAMLHAPAYRAENAGALRQDWPRVPLPDNAADLAASAALGRRLAALLDTETPVPGVTTGTLPPDLRLLGPIQRTDGGQINPGNGDLRVTAGWGHAGQGGVTMPGKGKLVARDYTLAEQAALADAAPAHGLTAAQVTACLGPDTRDIALNPVAYWRNIPARVWDDTLGGYQVMKKWLSYREFPLLGRDLTPDEAREVTAMARRLAALRLLEPALDAQYQTVQAAAYRWKRDSGR